MYDKRIVLRKPRQRYDKRLLPMFVVESPPGKLLNCDIGLNEPLEGSVKKVFEFEGYDGYGGKQKYDALEVRYNGWIIPCYRTRSADNNYVICQRYSYKAVKE